MKEKNYSAPEVKESRFPFSLFWVFLAACLLISGVNVGLVVGMNNLEWNDIIQVHIILIYWIAVAALLTVYVKKKIENVYDIPMRKVSEATKKVASGDFTVRIDAKEAGKEPDYLDIMIEDINLMIEELNSIETLKTDFVSNVSHEMKTPIAVIKNAAQMLQMPALNETQKTRYAKTIEKAASDISNLITNILKLNRLENQKIIPAKSSYDICRQLCDCVLLFEEKWEQKNIELEMDIEERAYVTADAELMEIVWNNLISNAVKFTESGGKITVKERSANGYVTVSVSDTGCGMDGETKKHIFDKFYQGDSSHATEGNGLGLALVAKIIQLTGGSISVESIPKSGSTFTVTLATGGQK